MNFADENGKASVFVEYRACQMFTVYQTEYITGPEGGLTPKFVASHSERCFTFGVWFDDPIVIDYDPQHDPRTEDLRINAVIKRQKITLPVGKTLFAHLMRQMH